VASVHGRLVLAPGPPRPAAWAQNVWFDPLRIRFGSIKEAASILRGMQRNWALCPIAAHRRAELIRDQLPHVSAKPLVFPSPPPAAPLGSWALLDRDMMIAAARCSSPFPNGEARFVENKAGPPNRAYLKLWEALTLAGAYPGPGDLCLDLGASPGGWTWVLHELGARVISVDKAPLAPEIAALPRLSYRNQSAFALIPAEIGAVDWLCADIISYPDRLLRLVETWLASGLAKRFVCTVKFQGQTDHEAAAAFQAIPGSRLVHLFHNKHELTWIKLDNAKETPEP
jgi:23S rRNA (cytidine2498-2'-O)-methyltransferase